MLEHETLNLNLYPEEGHCSTIAVYNLEGEIVFKKKVEYDAINIHTLTKGKKFANGIYMVLYRTQFSKRTEKLIIQ